MVEDPGSQQHRRAAQLLAEGAFLRHLASRLVRHEHVAADLVQDAWLVALQQGPRRQASLRPWLGRILRHLAWKLHRSTERRRRIEQRGARPEATPPAVQLVEALELQRAVRDAVLALREPYRRVVLLRYLDGLPPQAIAVQLGISTATVKTRLKRALAHLRLGFADRNGERRPRRPAWAALLAGRHDGPRVRTLGLSLLAK